MEIEKVIDQAKNWLGTRLKNPYFGSVIAVWIVTNRNIVFGLFNFEEKLTLEQRISWIHNELESFKLLDFINGFHGFEATLVWSFFMGFVVMIVLNRISGWGEYLYKWSDKSTINLVQKIEPAKWVERAVFDELQNSAVNTEEELKLKRAENNRLERENESAFDQLTKLKSDNLVSNRELEELKIKNVENENSSKSKDESIKSLTELSAKANSELETLKREINIVRDKTILSDIFLGRWNSTFYVPAQNGKKEWFGSEKNIQITPDMKYLVNSKHVFNIDMIDYDYPNKRIKFRKTSLDAEMTERITCDLRIVNNNYIEGREDNVTTGNNINITYRKI